MGEGSWCPSVLCTPPSSTRSPWYLSCQQEKVTTTLFFLAPSPSFLPQSKFVLLFDLNTYPWLWTRESGSTGKR